MRSLVLGLSLIFTTCVLAQATGFNFTIQYAHPLVDGDKGMVPSGTFGMGVQHDFTDRLGVGLDVNYSSREDAEVHAWEVIYSTKYFTSDNDGTALYIGSLIGLQSYGGTGEEYIGSSNGYTDYRTVEVSNIQIPVGLRTGVRGGLDGYFAEIFVQAAYNIGNGVLYNGPEGPVKSSPMYFGVGFSFLGFGWD